MAASSPKHRGNGPDPERLDVSQLGELLREQRGALSIRQAAADAGVSFSTFSRVEAGAQPDLATFTRLCAWLGVPAGRFFAAVAERELTPLDQAVSHLRSDPRLTPDAATKISTFLTDMYSALAADMPAARPAVACHLRAASVMRPGVPHRLASLLQDMHDELEARVERGEA